MIWNNLIILASGRADLLGIALSCGALLAVIVAAFFGVRWIQKKTDPRLQNDEQTGCLTMEQLEAIHDAGQITDEEFSAMRRVVLGLPETKEKSSDCSTEVVIMPDSCNVEIPTDKDESSADGVENEES